MATSDVKQGNIGKNSRLILWIFFYQFRPENIANFLNEFPGVQCVDDVAVAG